MSVLTSLFVTCLSIETYKAVDRKYFYPKNKCLASISGSDNVVYRKVSDVFTATRMNEARNLVRIFGPEMRNSMNLHRIITVDEFFVTGCNTQIPETSDPVDSLLYFFEDSEDLDANTESRHGIQLFYKSKFKSLAFPNPQIPLVTHMREPFLVPSFPLENPPGDSSDLSSFFGEGGGTVRVISGECGGVKAGPPLDDFTFLDVNMRPSSSIRLPIPSHVPAILYVVEGVGFVGGSNPQDPIFEAAYENEGHALWVPDVHPESNQTSILLVSSHQWSSLRFVLFAG